MAWTYSDLVTKAGQWLGRSDLSNQIDDAILLFESEYNTKQGLWRQRSTATISLESGDYLYTLPADFESVVSIDRVGYPNSIKVTSVDGLSSDRIGTGEPSKCAIYTDDRLLFAPTADGEYEYELVYKARLDGLNSVTTTNWLLNKYPHVYLYGVLYYLLEYVQDAERANRIIQKHEANLASLTNLTALPEIGGVVAAEQSMP